MLLAGQAQPLGLGARGQNHSVRRIGCAAVPLSPERAYRQIKGLDVIADNLGPGFLGVGFHPHHQVRTHHTGITGPVFHICGDRQLPTGLDALNQNRFQHRAAGIDAGGITGGAGADDQ